MKLHLALLILVLGLPATAVAGSIAAPCGAPSSFAPAASCSDGRAWRRDSDLHVEGRLGAAVYRKLAVLLERDPGGIRHIRLNSAGGNIDHTREANGDIYRVARLIREKRLSTHVAAGDICASACTLLFQSGATRHLEPGGRLVYHGVRIVNPYYVFRYLKDCRSTPASDKCAKFDAHWYADCERATRRFFDQLEQFGASTGLYQRLLAMPDEDNHLSSYNCFRKQDLVVEWDMARSFDVANR